MNGRVAIGLVVLLAILVAVCVAGLRAARGAAHGTRSSETFWTEYGGAIPQDEQVRRFDAAEKGVPDEAWAEAYWPPIGSLCDGSAYCKTVLRPVRGEPILGNN